jgi:hypothetical protein
MATDRVLCSKPCSLQNQGSSYTDGTFYVYQTIARFMGKAGTGKLELDITDIKGKSVVLSCTEMVFVARFQGQQQQRQQQQQQQQQQRQ